MDVSLLLDVSVAEIGPNIVLNTIDDELTMLTALHAPSIMALVTGLNVSFRAEAAPAAAPTVLFATGTPAVPSLI
jgi:branched-subunit amino acid transport protein